MCSIETGSGVGWWYSSPMSDIDWRAKYIRRKYGKTVEEYEAGLAAKANVKTCRKCHAEKPLDQFDEDTRNTGDIGKGRVSQCKECRRAAEAVWKAAHPEQARQGQKDWHDRHKADQRDKALRRKYGITSVQYDTLLFAQGGHCAICPATEAGGNGVFHVDHDHATGKVRGLLCHACNTMVTEHFEKYVAKAVAYLSKFGAKQWLQQFPTIEAAEAAFERGEGPALPRHE